MCFHDMRGNNFAFVCFESRYENHTFFIGGIVLIPSFQQWYYGNFEFWIKNNHRCDFQGLQLCMIIHMFRKYATSICMIFVSK